MIFAGPLLGYLGFCWRLLGLEFQVQPKHGSVEVEFLGRFRAHVGPFAGMSGLCWAFLGPIGALLAAFGAKIYPPTEEWFR